MIQKLIDANELKREMCRKCIDTDEETEKGRAKWDSGLWIRYKVFEDAIILAPTVDIDAITESHEKIGYDKGFRDGYAQATSEVKHGYWIENDTTYSEVTRQTCTCSVCGRHSLRPLGEFCRWCGAKMDEVREDGRHDDVS